MKMNNLYRMENILNLVHLDPILEEDYIITYGRAAIYIKTAIRLYINDFIGEDGYSHEDCLSKMMKASGGSLNPKVVQDFINEIWGSE